MIIFYVHVSVKRMEKNGQKKGEMRQKISPSPFFQAGIYKKQRFFFFWKGRRGESGIIRWAKREFILLVFPTGIPVGLHFFRLDFPRWDFKSSLEIHGSILLWISHKQHLWKLKTVVEFCSITKTNFRARATCIRHTVSFDCRVKKSSDHCMFQQKLLKIS